MEITQHNWRPWDYQSPMWRFVERSGRRCTPTLAPLYIQKNCSMMITQKIFFILNINICIFIILWLLIGLIKIFSHLYNGTVCLNNNIKILFNVKVICCILKCF